MNKKLNLIWLFSLLMMVQVCFVSCNKDDDEDTVSVADLKTAIIGTWKSVTMSADIDGKKFEQNSTDQFYSIIEFKSDGSYVATDLIDGEKDTDNGTWKLDGDKLIFDNDVEDALLITIKGNTLTTTEEDTYKEDGEEHHEKYVITYKKQ